MFISTQYFIHNTHLPHKIEGCETCVVDILNNLFFNVAHPQGGSEGWWACKREKKIEIER